MEYIKKAKENKQVHSKFIYMHTAYSTDQGFLMFRTPVLEICI